MMNRYESFDTIKFFAVLSVLIIHAGFLFNVQLNGVDLSYYGVLFNTTSRYAVPFFFITAGFLFTIKASKAGYYKGYILKLIKIYMIWSLIYLVSGVLYQVFLGASVPGYLKETLSVTDFLYYGRKISEPLWFMPALIIAVSLVALSCKYRFFKVLFPVAVLLHLTGLFALPQNYGIFFSLPVFTRDALFFGLFYVALGSFMAQNERYKSVPLKPFLWILLTVISFVLLSLERISLLQAGKFAYWGDFYLALIPLILFLFFTALSLPHLGRNSLFDRVGKGALGIYLIHSLIYHWSGVLLEINNLQSLYRVFWFQCVNVIGTFFLSYLLYYALPGVIKKLLYKKSVRVTESSAA